MPYLLEGGAACTPGQRAALHKAIDVALDQSCAFVKAKNRDKERADARKESRRRS